MRGDKSDAVRGAKLRFVRRRNGANFSLSGSRRYDQDQVGLKVKSGLKLAAMTFHLNQILPAGPKRGAIHRGQMWLMLDQQNTFLVAQYYRQIEQVLFWLSLCFGYSQAEAD
jgi:hypothetical protein